MKKVKYHFSQERSNPTENSIKLNLGCGEMYLPGWVNVDLDLKVKPDIVCGFNTIHEHFKAESVSEVLMLHSISYLRLWEARDFFRRMHTIMKSGGHIVIEFPDLLKCSGFIQNTKDVNQYLEGVRGIFAFDLNQIEKRESFTTYMFGWSAWHMQEELRSAGFKNIQILDPESHGKRAWRDTRIVAVK